MVLDITKKTGDSLSADEFNEVVSAINSKVDKESGKGLSSNDYTTQDKNDLFTLKGDLSEVRTQVRELINNPVSASVAVTDNEKKVGLYNVLGKSQDLYECTFVLEGLPITQGSTKDFILTDEPLGNKTYISYRDLVVTDGTTFYTGCYSVVKLFVDENLNTCLTIRCNETVSGTLKATLTLQYIKLEAVRVDFKISNLAASVDKSALTLQFPLLKYGKKFAYTYTFDDDTVMAYGKAFCTIHKKWVDNERFFHVGQPKTSGSIPTKTLAYTDGLGNEKRFTFGVAIWPDYLLSDLDNMMEPANHAVDRYYPYLVWDDLPPLLDFGNDIYFHNINDRVYDKESAQGIAAGFRAAQAITVEKTGGTGIKILARPDGNNTYISGGRIFEDIVMMTAENRIDDGSNPLEISFDQDIDLYKKTQFRRYVESQPNADSLIEYITQAHDSNTAKWIHDFSHGPSEFQYILDLLIKINDLYGKDGNDSVWFATMDEIYEYWLIRKFTHIRKTVESDGVHFTLFIPTLRYSRHTDFTVQIPALAYSNQTIEPISNILGLTYGSIGGVFSININANKNLPNLAEKYTSRYESSSLDEDKEDALYFISQLREDLKAPFIARLNVGEVPPVLNSVSINSGAASTYDLNVTVALDVIGKITHYKISENQDLTSVSWIEGTSKSLAFNLSSGAYGLKNIYVQVKNTYGESEIKGDSIEYIERPSTTYTVTARANNSAYGSVTPASQTVSPGSSVDVTANANSGYIIESWSGADSSTGIGQSQGTARVTNIQSDKTVICNFKQEGGTPPTGKDKWILSFGWSYSDAVYDSATGIDKQMGASVDKDMHTSTGEKKGKVLLSANGSAVHASLSTQTDKRGACPGDDSGIYPDAYMANMMSPYTSNTSGERPTMNFIFKNMVNGNYKVRLFSSTINTGLTQGDYKLQYFANDQMQEKNNNFPVNNLTEYVEWENVPVTDTTLTIKVVSPGNNKGIPVNVIEIEQL